MSTQRNDWGCNWKGLGSRLPFLILSITRPAQPCLVPCRRLRKDYSLRVIFAWGDGRLGKRLRSTCMDRLELIFNVDEAGFLLSCRQSSVLVRQGMKSPSSSSSAQSTQNTPSLSLSASSDSQQLHNFFSQLLNTSQTPSCHQASARHGLTGSGESLTNEEAMERVRIAEEDKKKVQEKEEKRRIRSK